MKKYIVGGAALLLPLLTLSGCSFQRAGTGSSAFYLAAALLSLVLLFACAAIVRLSEPWILALFACIAVINCGYLALALSDSVAEALWANRVAYLGSVFLLPSMLMILLKTTGTRWQSWLPTVLLIVGTAVFLVTASPGVLDIYYKSVTLEIVNGAAVLRKVYGPWHRLHMVYLLVYFAAMVYLVLRAVIRQLTRSAGHAAVLIFAVFINLGVWLMEQFLSLDFELLAVSYIVTELLLLGAIMMQREYEAAMARMALAAEPQEVPPEGSAAPDEIPAEVSEDAPESITEEITGEQSPEEEPEAAPEDPPKPAGPTPTRCAIYRVDLLALTPTERAVHDLYTEGKSSREIQRALDISENTLKYHNRNIYSKLQVSSRKELLEISRAEQKFRSEGLLE